MQYKDRLPTSKVIRYDEKDNKPIIEAQVYGEGVKRWLLSVEKLSIHLNNVKSQCLIIKHWLEVSNYNIQNTDTLILIPIP